MPSKAAKSKKGRRKKKKPLVFPNVSVRDIVNPFNNVRRARRERQKVFRMAIRNKPDRVRTAVVDLEKKGVLGVADIDGWLTEIYDSVFHPPIYAKGQKPPPGLEYPGGKNFTLINGGRLNTLSMKELMKMAVSMDKHKQKEILTTGVARTENEFMLKQCSLLESQIKERRTKIDIMERERMDLDAAIKYTNRVYGEKLKYTMSEGYANLFNKKIDHLHLHLHKQQRYWKIEKEKYERWQAEKEAAAYNNILLERVGRDIDLSGLAKRQIAKEDYLMCLRTKFDNFENYMTDTQAEVENVTKAHIREVDALKRKNFEGLIANQDKSISEMRKFFQGVNTANASIIHQLKAEVNAKRFKLDRLEKDLCLALEEHARYSIPLQTTYAEIKKYEALLEDAEVVRNDHSDVWQRTKRLEDHVLRLKWKKEIEQVKFEKAKESFDSLHAAYTNSMLEVARKASVALLVHSKTCELLETEATFYGMSHMIMQHFASTDPHSVLQRDSSIEQLFAKQEADIMKLRAQGILLRRKYNANRHAMYALFEALFTRPLSSTGFQIPKLEVVIPKCLTMFAGISDDQLTMLGFNGSAAFANIPSVV